MCTNCAHVYFLYIDLNVMSMAARTPTCSVAVVPHCSPARLDQKLPPQLPCWPLSEVLLFHIPTALSSDSACAFLFPCEWCSACAPHLSLHTGSPPKPELSMPATTATA